MRTMIVFCHLRWDFVFQRPQHLLSRLAQQYKILLVEEPIHHDGAAFMKRTEVADNITVCQPHTNCHSHGFHDDQLPLLKPLISDLVAGRDDPVVWFYTPMALPLLQGINPSLVIYDCMDELAAFQNSPKQLLQRETALLGMADVVFTGGPSLYQAKRERHHNVHCFSSSVDAAHFGKAINGPAHPAQDALPRPRLGFYGVIDERFDIDLLRAMADAHPEWQLAMVGPIVKIDPASLPRNPNIHYFGQQSYDALPQFLAGWDVCLLPFAMNDSTKFISPTKVLEYMAAELPVVSTPITDVKVPYGHVVAIAGTHAGFIAACETALAMTAEQRAAMIETMRGIVANTSWNKTAEHMTDLIEAAPRRPQGKRAPAKVGVGVAANAPRLRSTDRRPPKNVVAGAAKSGLSAA